AIPPEVRISHWGEEAPGDSAGRAGWPSARGGPVPVGTLRTSGPWRVCARLATSRGWKAGDLPRAPEALGRGSAGEDDGPARPVAALHPGSLLLFHRRQSGAMPVLPGRSERQAPQPAL